LFNISYFSFFFLFLSPRGDGDHGWFAGRGGAGNSFRAHRARHGQRFLLTRCSLVLAFGRGGGAGN